MQSVPRVVVMSPEERRAIVAKLPVVRHAPSLSTSGRHLPNGRFSKTESGQPRTRCWRGLGVKSAKFSTAQNPKRWPRPELFVT